MQRKIIHIDMDAFYASSFFTDSVFFTLFPFVEAALAFLGATETSPRVMAAISSSLVFVKTSSAVKSPNATAIWERSERGI